MKRLFAIICFAILIFQILGCNKSEYHMNSFYSDLKAAGEEKSYNVSGSAYIAQKADLVYMSPVLDTNITLSGKIRNISGNVQVVYVKPDNEVIVIADSSDSKKNSFKIDTVINLSEGEGHLEFRGDKASFKFDIHLTNISREDFDYIGIEKTDEDLYEQEDEEDEDYVDDADGEEDEEEILDSDSESGELLNDVSVLYPKDDGSSILLTTNLDQSTKIKVSIRMDVTSVNDNKMKLGKFELIYKADNGKNFKVLEHKENEVSFGGYESGENYETELTLPAGNNELIVKTAKGENYKVNFRIKVIKSE